MRVASSSSSLSKRLRDSKLLLSHLELLLSKQMDSEKRKRQIGDSKQLTEAIAFGAVHAPRTPLQAERGRHTRGARAATAAATLFDRGAAPPSRSCAIAIVTRSEAETARRASHSIRGLSAGAARPTIGGMIPNTIKSYLDEHRIAFHVATHSPRVTAQEIAATAHISGKRFAKTVVLKRDGQYFLAAVPASESIDLDRFRRALGPSVDVATERELAPLFPDCETGAMPPLGGLFGLPVIADECLARAESIAVNGGTHTDVIELRWEDFVRAEHPRLLAH